MLTKEASAMIEAKMDSSFIGMTGGGCLVGLWYKMLNTITTVHTDTTVMLTKKAFVFIDPAHESISQYFVYRIPYACSLNHNFSTPNKNQGNGTDQKIF